MGGGADSIFYFRARVHNIAPTSTWPRLSRQQLFMFNCADSPKWSRTRVLDADTVGNQRITENEMKHLKSFLGGKTCSIARAGNQRNYIPRGVMSGVLCHRLGPGHQLRFPQYSKLVHVEIHGWLAAAILADCEKCLLTANRLG